MSTPEAPGRACWAQDVNLRVLSVGSALPGMPISTKELLDRIANQFGVDIRRRGSVLARRLGISARHISRALQKRHEGTQAGNTNAELAAKAVERALTAANATVSDLAYLIAHTATPGELMPPNVVQVARLLSYKGPFVELRQACTGFANAIVMASGLLSQQSSALVAIVGSETGSVYFDPLTVVGDKGQLVNLVQMGDGAGAVVVGSSNPGSASGLTHVFFGQCSEQHRSGFHLVGAGSDAPAGALPQFAHEFATVRRHGPALFEQSIAAASSLGVDLRRVNYIIPHQANGQMAITLAGHLGIDPCRVFVNADHVGNTGSAAMWLAFGELRDRLNPGDTVLALGAEATGYMFGGFHYVHG